MASGGGVYEHVSRLHFEGYQDFANGHYWNKALMPGANSVVRCVGDRGSCKNDAVIDISVLHRDHQKLVWYPICATCRPEVLEGDGLERMLALSVLQGPWVEWTKGMINPTCQASGKPALIELQLRLLVPHNGKLINPQVVSFCGFDCLRGNSARLWPLPGMTEPDTEASTEARARS